MPDSITEILNGMIQQIKERRTALKISQETLAKRAKIGRVTLVNMELGKFPPRVRTYAALINALNQFEEERKPQQNSAA